MTTKSRFSSILFAACAASLGVSSCGISSDNAAEKALAEEQKYTIELGSFYEKDQAERAFGELIRSEVATDYNIPKGSTATRILYRSEDSVGRPSTASAVVVVPEGETPEGGWPLVVWAHGTTGMAPHCGPSASSYLQYYSPELMGKDFALLVVDYAGLATKGQAHQYMSRPTNALDIEAAVPAARAAVDSLGEKWVAIGHSQGGAAVWGLAEHKAKRPDAGYLGAMAYAPAVGGEVLVNNNASIDGETFYPLFWAFAIKAHDPEFDLSSMLTDEALKFYPDVTTKGCWDYGFARTYNQLRAGTVLHDGWDELPTVKRFMKSIRSGDQPVAGALLIAAGREDVGVKPEYIYEAVKRQCKSGGNVHYGVYPGAHDPVLENSTSFQVQWIKDRFNGVPATSNCE